VNALFHVWHVEVQEQTQLVTAQAQIRQQLSAMDGQHSFDALDLDDETLFNDEIHPVRGVKLNAFVHDWESHLLFKVNARLCEFIRQTGTARTFEHAGSEGGVDTHRTANNELAGGVWLHEMPVPSFVSSVSFVSSKP
jgi:hypothetical protein